ncbi:hypothetical protein [Nonomuraea turcica]|uniref:hypothetical protein n=1 Tax=Nonomuraea sp. G32 TaxID=3067274 RepID=UPI00273CC2B1|nr:hypothetical protein [Nonomuraea sp. G32]MDP4511845.1 hypothetical protein [Nonomuraea sp. G32]
MDAVLITAALAAVGYLLKLLTTWVRERSIQQRVLAMAMLPPGSQYADARAGVRIQIGSAPSGLAPGKPTGEVL